MSDPPNFNLEIESALLALMRAQSGASDAVRGRLENLGITMADVADAVTWPRRLEGVATVTSPAELKDRLTVP